MTRAYLPGFSPLELLISLAVFVILVGLSAFPLRHYGRRFILPGIPVAAKQLALGMTIGFAAPSLMLMIAWAFGQAEFIGFGIDDSFGLAADIRTDWWKLLSGFLTVSLNEELIFRGLLFLIPLWIVQAMIDLGFRQCARHGDYREEPHADKRSAGMDTLGGELPDSELPFLKGPESGQIRVKYNSILRLSALSRFPAFPYATDVFASRSIRTVFFVIAFTVILMAQAVAFSLAHSSNPNLTSLALINIFLAGVLFAFLAYRKGGFYAAIGAHWLWNFSYEVYDLPVSGIVIGTGQHIVSFRLADRGIVGGGAFGLEGGIACTTVLFAIIISILAATWLYSQNRISLSKIEHV